uniref:Uncharacterized protein n=1 Tax=Accipiter nisus TaxID=211598 RepID=A0A8B9RUV0_9AVES
MLITSFTQKLRPLRPEPYQVLVSKVHRQVLIEYMRPLLQVCLVCTSAKLCARVAARLGNKAHQLHELFSRLVRLCPLPGTLGRSSGGGDGTSPTSGECWHPAVAPGEWQRRRRRSWGWYRTWSRARPSRGCRANAPSSPSWPWPARCDACPSAYRTWRISHTCTCVACTLSAPARHSSERPRPQVGAVRHPRSWVLTSHITPVMLGAPRAGVGGCAAPAQNAPRHCV